MSQPSIASLLDAIKKSWPVLTALIIGAGWVDKQFYVVRQMLDTAWTLEDQMDWSAWEASNNPTIKVPNPNSIHRKNHPLTLHTLGISALTPPPIP